MRKATDNEYRRQKGLTTFKEQTSDEILQNIIARFTPIEKEKVDTKVIEMCEPSPLYEQEMMNIIL